MRNSSPASPHLPKGRSALGFTLIELLVVISIIALLATMLLGALHSAQSKAQGVVCLGNLKQLQLAWHFYASDHSDVLPPNGIYEYFSYRYPTWVGGSISHPFPNLPAPWITDVTNTALLVEPGVGRIGPYLKSPGVYKCPSDKSVVMYGGKRYPRVRSYSMNLFMGHAVNAWTPEVSYYYYARLSQIQRPPPSLAWVFIDQHEDTMSGPMFQIAPEAPNAAGILWVSLPASRHGLAGTLSYVDGHVEMHRWRDPRTTPKPKGENVGRIECPGNQDYLWLAERTTARVPGWRPW
jgi:prepilin-type N-terminal cleavage/methylation domain-containing protein/prepilin-type processing-associated H-X9-DG protein